MLGGGFAAAAFPARAQGAAASIAAAASLNFVLPELMADFRRRGGGELVVVYGASGNLARQITQGAPHQLFLSADEVFVAHLAAQGFVRDRGVVYALGRLALFAAHGSPVRVDARLAGLRAALRAGHVQRFAIANPETAPYGRAAIEALTHAGLWPQIAPHIVRGENVAQAAQFASTGAAQAGLVAASLTAAPNVAARGRAALVPADWHAPLAHRMALIGEAGAAARAFYAYMQTPRAQAILRRWGFSAPGVS